jgi:cation-transporting ATPase E
VVGDGRVDVDESLLTGESDLVTKHPGDPVLSGSFCVNGSVLYEAQKVGLESYANQITAGARAFRRVLTPLQTEVNLVIRVLILVVAYFEIMLVAASYFNDTPIVESVKMSVVIAGLVPNGLFLATAVAYSLGAVRIARRGALVQQANAVESLSNVDVLCLDKTGTLTSNALRMEETLPLCVPVDELAHALGDYAANTQIGNLTIAAIAQACPGQKRNVKEEVPFSSEQKWSALAFDDPARRGVYVLGAPEMLRLALKAGSELSPVMDEWTALGLRVLLLACRCDLPPLQDAHERPQLPPDLEPLGLISFSDQLRPEARDTLKSFAKAGIALKIISGDNPQTVMAVAQQAGLPAGARMIAGTELAHKQPAEFAQAAEDTTIFGRITPQQKQDLVKALKSRGHYVAMIGDGVNDVLSLKQANLGIAMQSGSQATRSVADIVLLNDSFASLPQAFREGQRILNGMQDILKIFLTRVVYVALLILSTGLLGGFPFEPKQSSLLALLTVGIPTVALATWAKPGRPPRRDLVRSLMYFVLPAAISISLIALLGYMVLFVNAFGDLSDAASGSADALIVTQAQAIAQTGLTTITVMCGLLLLAFVQPPVKFFVGGDALSRDWRPTILALVEGAAYLLLLTVPDLQPLFALTPLTPVELGLIGIAVIVWMLLLRFTYRMRLLERFISADLV